MRLRIQRLKLWTSWATELAIVGKEYKQKCDPRVKAVLGAKRLFLSINWPDISLFQEMAQGFRLVGQAIKSNVFNLVSKRLQ